MSLWKIRRNLPLIDAIIVEIAYVLLASVALLAIIAALLWVGKSHWQWLDGPPGSLVAKYGSAAAAMLIAMGGM